MKNGNPKDNSNEIIDKFDKKLEVSHRHLRNYRYGLFAEYFIALILRLRGYRILARRYKTKFGEIDILASRRSELKAFEVKARSSGDNLTSEIVSKKQLRRIRGAINVFLSKNPSYIDYNISMGIVLYRNIFDFKIFSEVI